MRTANFLDTIGVNTHINWQDSGSAYANQETIKEAIEYLGVGYVRDGVPYEGWTLPFYQELANAGVKFNLLTMATAFNETGSFETDLDRISALAEISPGSVASIEGLNEINTWTVDYKGQNTGSNLALGREVQALLYSQVQADAALASIPVLNLTVGGLTAQQASVMGDMSELADYGTWHTYFGNGDQPLANITSGIAAARLLNPADAVQITETNYYTAVDSMEWGGGGVTEEVQAKFDLNLLLDAAKGGVARTYLYELLDNGLSPTTTIEGSLGLFHSDGTPKQAATAIHNLGVILEDSAANASSFTTSALDVSVDGLSDTGRTLLMQKADGSYSLAIWAEPDIWNEQSRTAISAPTQSVTITLGTAAGTITVYDPLTGTSAIASAKDADSITVEVTDHPLIIDIAGPSTAPVAESPAEEEPPVAQPPATQPPVVDAGGTVIGTGSDTLVLKISQDAWQGDAQYTVSVDGEQLGGTLTARALSGSGESDTVTLQGDWGLGGHEVSVSFINDAWGGSSSTDRDLHVDSVTYNGVAAGRATTLYGNGAAHFTVKDATGPDAAGSDATIGSGTDSIVLKIAQDAYDGDAQYVILVDGEQVGGTLTAGASHALGEHDTLTVKGSWAAGDHRLSVKFLNDAYDGTPETDRNLYVEGITYDGKAVAGGTATLLGAGTVNFTLTDLTAPADSWVL
ncbi:hypothetical protein GCM10011504_26560 [Siccirubricoccus deserti]|nr:hypothetical protein GCM10011504_26560 [Siccirubricoccus deserti]